MSFSSQSKFNLLRDQRKVANREVHGAEQEDPVQPVGRPGFLPSLTQPSSRAPSSVGDDFDVHSVGYVSGVSNKTIEAPTKRIVWDKEAQRFRDLDKGVYVSSEKAAQMLSMRLESHERVQRETGDGAVHQDFGTGAGLLASVSEDISTGLQTVLFKNV